MNMLQYIDRYNINIKFVEGFDLKLSIIVSIFLAVVALILIICALANKAKYNKTKEYSGHSDATFVSAELYDEKNKSKVKKAVVRYVVNEKPIIKRMKVPKNMSIADKLIVRYDVSSPNDAIILGDRGKATKSIRQCVVSSIFLVMAVCIYLI